MSNHDPGRRHRSSRRNNSDDKRRSPSRLPDTYTCLPVGSEEAYKMENDPALSPPPPRVYTNPEDEEFSSRPRPPQPPEMIHDYTRRKRQGFTDRSPRMHRFEHGGRWEDDSIEGLTSDDESMPEIQQTSRPELKPESGLHHFTMSAIPISDPRPPRKDEKKQTACGDIQLSAVRKATEDWMTLNSIMICVYRSSRRRFDSRRVWLVRKEFREKVGRLPNSLLRTDADFFNEVIWTYRHELRGNVRRFISFKTVSTARILEYGNRRFGTAGVNPKMFSPVFMAILNDPEASLKKEEPYRWVMWLRKIRLNRVQNDQVDLAIELLEDYDPMRVMGSIGFALCTLLILTAVWLIRGGDPAYVCSVMSFVLGFIGEATVALTALWDFLDLGHMGGGKDYLVLDQKEFQNAMRNERDWESPGKQFFAGR